MFAVYLIFQAADHFGHACQVAETFELLQQMGHFLQHTEVLGAERDIGDGIGGVFITVILLVAYDDGSIVAELVAAHGIEVHADGPETHPAADAFVFVQGFVTGFDKVFDGPLTTAVLQALVDGAITDKGIAVDGHGRFFTKKGKNILLCKYIAQMSTNLVLSTDGHE